jgi:hypothetical protein
VFYGNSIKRKAIKKRNKENSKQTNNEHTYYFGFEHFEAEKF